MHEKGRFDDCMIPSTCKAKGRKGAERRTALRSLLVMDTDEGQPGLGRAFPGGRQKDFDKAAGSGADGWSGLAGDDGDVERKGIEKRLKKRAGCGILLSERVKTLRGEEQWNGLNR